MYREDDSSRSTSTSARCVGCRWRTDWPVRSWSIHAGRSQARDGISVKIASKMWPASSVEMLRLPRSMADVGFGGGASREGGGAGMFSMGAGFPKAMAGADAGVKPALTGVEGGRVPSLGEFGPGYWVADCKSEAIDVGWG